MNSSKLNTGLAATAGALLILFLLAWWLSPMINASSIITAAQGSDLTTLIKRMDLPRIRAAAEEDLTERIPPSFRLLDGQVLPDGMRNQINESINSGGSDDPAFAEKLANLLIGKGFVSKEVLTQMPRQVRARRTPTFNSEYGDTNDTYVQRVTFSETGEQISLLLERRGWFTWRGVGIKLNSGSVLWPVRSPKT